MFSQVLAPGLQPNLLFRKVLQPCRSALISWADMVLVPLSGRPAASKRLVELIQTMQREGFAWMELKVLLAEIRTLAERKLRGSLD
jgi:hypothetical protein